MADDFASQMPSNISPIENGFAVTPSDSVDCSFVTRALWVGTGGDISILTRGGSTVVLKNAASGSLIPIRAVRVNLTNTTATDLVGLY